MRNLSPHTTPHYALYFFLHTMATYLGHISLAAMSNYKAAHVKDVSAGESYESIFLYIIISQVSLTGKG